MDVIFYAPGLSGGLVLGNFFLQDHAQARCDLLPAPHRSAHCISILVVRAWLAGEECLNFF